MMNYSYTSKMTLPVKFAVRNREFIVLRRGGVLSRIQDLDVTIKLLPPMDIRNVFLFELSGNDVGKAILILGEHIRSFKPRVYDQPGIMINSPNHLNAEDTWLNYIRLLYDRSLAAMESIPLASQSINFEFPMLSSISPMISFLKSLTTMVDSWPDVTISRYVDECHKMAVAIPTDQLLVNMVSIPDTILFELCLAYEHYTKDNLIRLKCSKGYLLNSCHCMRSLLILSMALSQPNTPVDIHMREYNEIMNVFKGGRHHHICAGCGVLEGKKRFKACRLCKKQCLYVRYLFCSFDCQVRSWAFHKWFHRVMNGKWQNNTALNNISGQ